MMQDDLRQRGMASFLRDVEIEVGLLDEKSDEQVSLRRRNTNRECDASESLLTNLEDKAESETPHQWIRNSVCTCHLISLCLLCIIYQYIASVPSSIIILIHILIIKEKVGATTSSSKELGIVNKSLGLKNVVENKPKIKHMFSVNTVKKYSFQTTLSPQSLLDS